MCAKSIQGARFRNWEYILKDTTSIARGRWEVEYADGTTNRMLSLEQAKQYQGANPGSKIITFVEEI